MDNDSDRESWSENGRNRKKRCEDSIERNKKELEKINKELKNE